MLPAAYVCVSVSECVSRHLWLPEFLSWKCAYMHVCVRVVSKRDGVASAHRPKADSRQRKQSGAIALASPISKSMSLLGLAVKPISRASCAATTQRLELTTLRSKPGSILMQDVDSLRSAEHRSSGSKGDKLPKGSKMFDITLNHTVNDFWTPGSHHVYRKTCAEKVAH